MKKTIFLIVTLFLLLSCADEYKSNLNTMSEKAKQTLEDIAFKENGSIEFFEFNPVRYDTVNENFLDELYYKKIEGEADRYREIVKLKDKKNDININLIERNKQMGIPIDETHKNMLIEDLDEANRCGRHLIDLISEQERIIENIEERANPEDIYRLTLFIKATLKENNGKGSGNLMDTLYYFFDKNLNMVTIPEAPEMKK